MLALAETFDDAFYLIKATVLSHTILALVQMQEYTWAKEVADQLLALSEAAVSAEFVDNEKALTEMAQALAQIGEKAYLIALGRRLVAAARAIEDDEKRVLSLIRVARALRDIGDEQVGALVKQARSESAAVRDARKRVSALCSVALLLQQIGEAGALDVLEQAAEVGRAMSSEYWVVYLKTRALQEVTETLANMGQVERALVIAEMIPDREARATTLGKVARILALSGERERALALANKAITIATAIERSSSKAFALIAMARTLAEAGSASQAEMLAKQAIQEASGVEDERRRIWSQRSVVHLLSRAGLVDRAVEAAETIENSPLWFWEKAATFREVTAALARAGRQEQAIDLANRVLAMAEEQETRESLQAEASIAFAQVGHDDLASELAGKMKNVDEKRRALKEIASVWCQAEKKERVREVLQELLTVVDGLEDVRERVADWLDIVPLLSFTGEEARADALIARALGEAKGIRYVKDEHSEAEALDKVAQVVASRGQFDEALEVAAQISGRGQKSSTYRKIALALAQAGEHTRALVAASKGLTEAIEGGGENATEREKDYFDRCIGGLATIALALDRGGEHAQAEALVGEALRIAEQAPTLQIGVIGILTALAAIAEKKQFRDVVIQAAEQITPLETREQPWLLSSLLEMLAQVGEQERAQVELEKALEVVTSIEDSDIKARVLGELARCLSNLGDHKQALALASRALTFTATMKSTDNRLWVLNNVVAILVQGDERERAITEAYEIARAAEASWDSAWLLTELVGILATLGQYEDAVKMAEGLQDVARRADAFIDIARALAQENVGEAASVAVIRALKTIEEMEPGWLQAADFMVVAQILCQAGQQEQAVEIASAIGDSVWKARALSGIASFALSAGNRVLAATLAEQALATTASIAVKKDRADVLRNMADLFGQLGEHDQAIALAIQALALGIKEAKNAVEALCDVAPLFVLAHRYPIARTLADQMASVTRGIDGTTYLKASLLARIARIPIQIEEFGQGEQLIAWIEEVASKNTVLTELMPALVRARRQKQALKVLEKAFADSRVVSRDEVFGAVEASVSILGALDRGQTLWRLYRALQEVEDWWVLPEI